MTPARDYVGVAADGLPARKAATVAVIEVSRGRDDWPDIPNAAIEELARRRFSNCPEGPHAFEDRTHRPWLRPTPATDPASPQRDDAETREGF